MRTDYATGLCDPLSVIMDRVARPSPGHTQNAMSQLPEPDRTQAPVGSGRLIFPYKGHHAIIEMARHQSICKSFASHLHHPDEGNVEYASDPGPGKSWRLLICANGRWNFVKYYSNIPSRLYWVSFDTKKLNRKQRYLLWCNSFPDKEEFSFFWVQFLFPFFPSTFMTGERPSSIVNHLVPSLDTKEMMRDSVSRDHATQWSGIEGKQQRI